MEKKDPETTNRRRTSSPPKLTKKNIKEGIEHVLQLTGPLEQEVITREFLIKLLEDHRDTITEDFLVSTKELKEEIKSLNTKLQENQDNLDSLKFDFLKQQEAYEMLNNKYSDIQKKLSDLGDRSRKINLRIRRVSEAIKNQEIKDDLFDFFKEIAT
ncbi:Hypothetical predicted protein [Pelobates cultripes]|uniref:Uncharacterized protein n=1 Tax=Pelobates cultripes TaxID=61616 RepID=A0AAD1T5W7_PELCU|nr:Hypothetical predicted protein [Pelobates cultripes]